MLSKTIGIIGIGPRGLSVLERIIASSIDTPEQPITIKTFDPNLPGSGCHDVKQPDHLLVNTVSSQITMFADHTVKHIKNVISGPTFYQWLSVQKHLNNYPSQVLPNEYYSRASFGKYLNWVFRYLIDMAPPHVTVEYQPLQVVDLEKVNSAIWHLIDEHNGVTEVDYLYVTTGHTNARNNTQDTPQEITNPYPVKAKLHSITEQHTVAIQGLGLTTCDILAELTIGHGGTLFQWGIPSRWN
ncbi:FAD/NAD(P)-binding protein [Vibrio sinaloensis]|uniref:FAD/NAD(P)-binding protein n=1 Tax=Photobacterium sp. (strain ATCC 43367) TaxID=379097 RepID=UPI0009DEBA79|nr:FAD/NAD(P)-binding protein [Vibrio sinaloensis]